MNYQSKDSFNRREFLSTSGLIAATGLTASGLLAGSNAFASPLVRPISTPETLVKTLFDSLSESQRQTVCFDCCPW